MADLIDTSTTNTRQRWPAVRAGCGWARGGGDAAGGAAAGGCVRMGKEAQRTRWGDFLWRTGRKG